MIEHNYRCDVCKQRISEEYGRILCHSLSLEPKCDMLMETSPPSHAEVHICYRCAGRLQKFFDGLKPRMASSVEVDSVIHTAADEETVKRMFVDAYNRREKQAREHYLSCYGGMWKWVNGPWPIQMQAAVDCVGMASALASATDVELTGIKGYCTAWIETICREQESRRQKNLENPPTSC